MLTDFMRDFAIKMMDDESIRIRMEFFSKFYSRILLRHLGQDTKKVRQKIEAKENNKYMYEGATGVP